MVNEMLMNKPAANKMTGLTLLETMLALAVGTVVLVGAIIFYQSTRQNANVSKTMSDMNAIRTGYKSYLASGYQFNASTDALQLQAVQDAGFLPNPLNNAWGQAYAVSVNNSTYPGYIVIGIPGLDAATNKPSNNTCQTIYIAVQATSGLSATPAGNIKCGFRYRFP
jgi:type II secretory pathway pseudopilin PulG